MTPGIRILISFTLLSPASGCDNRDAQKPEEPPRLTTPSASLGERLLGSLNNRQQWPSNAVKIWLKNPTLSLDVKSTDGKKVRLHAWGNSENDYNTAMMRLDEGSVLYAITKAEFEELRTRSSSEKLP